MCSSLIARLKDLSRPHTLGASLPESIQETVATLVAHNCHTQHVGVAPCTKENDWCYVCLSGQSSDNFLARHGSEE